MLWQRNYWERIIRNEDEMNRIRQYIIENPARWDEDPENSAAKAHRAPVGIPANLPPVGAALERRRRFH